MNKRNKGKPKKQKNPQPQPSPKIMTPTEAVPSTNGGISEIKTEETRVPDVKTEVVISAPVETSQEEPSMDKIPEKPKRNRSKRNKNKSENKLPVNDDEVTTNAEIKLPGNERESKESTENKINTAATDFIPEKETVQPTEAPITTSRKKNKNKNKNKNAENKPATLINQSIELENENKPKIESELKKQNTESIKANEQIAVEKDHKQDNSDSVPPTASRKKKGKNKNKAQSQISDSTNKSTLNSLNTCDEKNNFSSKEKEPVTNVTEISKNIENKNESKEQSNLKVTVGSSVPDAQNFTNLVTPNLEPISNLDFGTEEHSDKPLSKSARKRAKKNQNKNQGIQVTAELTNRDKIVTAQCELSTSNNKQDNTKSLSEDIKNETTNEKIEASFVNVLTNSETEEQKEKYYLEEIKQSLDRSLERLNEIEQFGKMEAEINSSPPNSKSSIKNDLTELDKEISEHTNKPPTADDFEKINVPKACLKEITKLAKSESKDINTENNKTTSEPTSNKNLSTLRLDNAGSNNISKILEVSTPNAISKIESEGINDGQINVELQETKIETNFKEDSLKKEVSTIHILLKDQNLSPEKNNESNEAVITEKEESVEIQGNNISSANEVNSASTSIRAMQVTQEQNENKSKNVEETILNKETNEIDASLQGQNNENATVLVENEQVKYDEKNEDIVNKSPKNEDGGKNNKCVDIAKPTDTCVLALEAMKEKQISDSNLTAQNASVSDENILEESEHKSETLSEKSEETNKTELSDDIELLPELIPLSLNDAQNENQIRDSVLITPENVTEEIREFSIPEEQLAPKQDDNKEKSLIGDKISQISTPKSIQGEKQSPPEIIEKDAQNLVQEKDPIYPESVNSKRDNIDAEFEMIAQSALKKENAVEISQKSSVQSSKHKDLNNKTKTDIPLQEKKVKENRSKNLIGTPDIPVISNKDDYKKEKNKKGKNKSKDIDASGSSFNGGRNKNEEFGSEGDDEEFVYKYSFRKVFMANACHICKISLKSHRIVCSYCNLISYCGQKHKDEDWPQHQALCFAISTIVHLKGLKFVYSDARSIGGQEYRLLRMQTIVSCEKILKRKLTPCEQEILLYPRMCLNVACREWKSAMLADCNACGQVSYCKNNPSHFLEEHKKWCESYKLYYKLVAHQQHKGRIEPRLPTKVISDTNFQLPDNTTDLVKELYEGNLDLDDVHYAALTQMATAPLTALYGYQQYLKKNSSLTKDDTSFTIHIVGAELQFEADMLSKWEVFFLHLHPTTVDLKVVFVGPELNPSKLPLDILSKIRLCKECRQAKRNLTFEFQDGLLYHNFAKSEKFSKPNLVCAFNPGLHRTTGYGGLDTWPETIKTIMALVVPVCITSYTSYELPRDLARLQEFCPQVQVQTEPQLNPYASIRPDRNFISDDEMPLIFKNYYFMVVTG